MAQEMCPGQIESWLQGPHLHSGRGTLKGSPLWVIHLRVHVTHWANALKNVLLPGVKGTEPTCPRQWCHHSRCYIPGRDRSKTGHFQAVLPYFRILHSHHILQSLLRTMSKKRNWVGPRPAKELSHTCQHLLPDLALAVLVGVWRGISCGFDLHFPDD